MNINALVKMMTWVIFKICHTSPVVSFPIIVNMGKVIAILLVVILGHSTSGQQYPNCASCQHGGEYDIFSIIIT